MQLSILPDTATSIERRPKGVDLTRLKTGARLEARIIAILPSGKTLLQFPGFRAATETPVKGRVGGRLLFEILPDAEDNQGRQPSDKAPGKSLPGANGARGQSALLHHNRVVRLMTLPEAGLRRTSAKAGTPSTPKSVTQSPSNTLPVTDPNASHGQSIHILGAWIKRFRKTLQRSSFVIPKRFSPSVKAEAYRGHLPQNPATLPGRNETEYADRKGAPPGVAGLSGFYLDGRPVKAKFSWNMPEKRGDAHQPAFKAVFLLDLEHTGPVRVDIQMAEKQINITFFVESEQCRSRFAEALPELKTALSPLARQSSCTVDVSPRRINDFMQGTDGFSQAVRFHARA